MGCTILHAFNWTFEEIRTRLEELKATGYQAVLTSPIAYSKGDAWYMRYQPLDFRLILSPLGNKQEFEQLVREARQFGIDIYVDVVINHMAHRLDDNLDFPGSAELQNYRTDPKFEQSRLYGDLSKNQFSADDFNRKAIIRNYNSVYEIRNYRIQDHRVPNGLPDFELNDWVISQQKQMLLALIDLGAAGFRIDAAKHVPVTHLNRITDDSALRAVQIFAEVIPNAHYEILKETLYNTNLSLYDFPLFHKMRKAFKWGESLRRIYHQEEHPLISRFRAITFANTHDIPNNEAMADQMFYDLGEELLATAYILGRDGGCPLIFTDKGDNIHETESFGNRWKNFYRDPTLKQMIRFHNHAHGSPMRSVWVDDGIIAYERVGRGFFAINKTSDEAQLRLSFSSLAGPLHDVLSTDSVTVRDGQADVRIPARSSRMFVNDR